MHLSPGRLRGQARLGPGRGPRGDGAGRRHVRRVLRAGRQRGRHHEQAEPGLCALRLQPQEHPPQVHVQHPAVLQRRGRPGPGLHLPEVCSSSSSSGSVQLRLCGHFVNISAGN